jgi:hypothetical protein
MCDNQQLSTSRQTTAIVMAPKLPPNSKGKGHTKVQPEDKPSTPTDQSASASQADSEPHEHEAMIVDDGAAPSAKASGKQKVRPPSMEDLDQHLVLTHDGGSSHTDTSCNDCHKFHDHMHHSHASEKHATLRRVYHEQNSAQVLQEEFDRGRAKERNAQYDKQPPWLSATLASAGEALDGVNINAIWNHSFVTGAVSGWLIICCLIGTVARGSFRLTSAALVECIVPLLGNTHGQMTIMSPLCNSTSRPLMVGNLPTSCFGALPYRK